MIARAPEVLPSPAAPARLGLHILAHLRAVAQGLSPTDSARRYLIGGADTEQNAQAAHRAAVDAAARVARRAGLGSRWRLLRIGQLPSVALAAPVDLEAWGQAQGYEGFSFAEIQAAYEDAHGTDNPVTAQRKARQIARLHSARLALLRELEAYTGEPPALTDPLDLWFADDLAARLRGAGFLMLGELREAIAHGGRWWRGLPGFGPIKARALADQVGALVGWPDMPTWPLDADMRANTIDVAALMESWIAARTSSVQTARAYRREVQRFLAWLALQRHTSITNMTTDDCAAYIVFLQHVPPEWISRRHAGRFAPGWAPFAGQPSVSSQRYALTILNAFFAWLVRAGHQALNPWEWVNLRLPDDPMTPVDDSRAFTSAAWAVLQEHVQRLSPDAAARMRWLLAFTLACGLRAGELLRARRADFAWLDGACWLRVYGKGSRNRTVPVPASALAATREYFNARGLNFETAHPNTPLLTALAVPALTSLDDASASAQTCPPPDARERTARGFVSYPTLAAAFKRFTVAAITASALPPLEREHARAASLHWLRHTHATRAAEGDVPIDIQQANLGHADPRMTARYYRAQRKRRQEQMERVFGKVDGYNQ